MDRVHPRVGSGQVGSGHVGSRFFHYIVGSVFVSLCGSPWIIQNVSLSVIAKLTQFSESLVLLKLYSV